MRTFALPLLALTLFAASPAPDGGPLSPESYLPDIVLIEAVPTAVGLLDIGATVEGFHYVRKHGTTPVAIVPDWWLDKVGGQIDATVGVTFCIKYLQHHGPWGVMTQEVHKQITATVTGKPLAQCVAGVVSSVQAQLPPAGSYHVVPCKDAGP